MGGRSFDNDFIRRRRGAGSFVALVISSPVHGRLRPGRPGRRSLR